ncbi:4-coumarate:CoA ligase, putative [Medicago truncatula]|uniref:4-coumarate:CoA ligase, putative n=1 Tax=Medicago truncatula TaxID=3880 RepID=G7J517_MEDTR|nr:4-coumarate:CoA ligase, putative [Medicago truncatula]
MELFLRTLLYQSYQVPPAELEHILHTNPEIADAAVVPYPDEDVRQIPMAFVVRKPGSNITAAQVMDYVAKQVCSKMQISGENKLSIDSSFS